MSDLETAKNAVLDMVKVSLNQHQFDALTSLVFNVGANKVSGYKLIEKLNAGDYEGAAHEFLDIVNITNKDGSLTKVDGLVTRREEEYDLFMNGTYDAN